MEDSRQRLAPRGDVRAALDRISADLEASERPAPARWMPRATRGRPILCDDDPMRAIRALRRWGDPAELEGRPCPVVGGACAAPACVFWLLEGNTEGQARGLCLHLAALAAQTEKGAA